MTETTIAQESPVLINGIGIIPLSKGRVVFVDEDMFDMASRHRWHCAVARLPNGVEKYYARRSAGPGKKMIYLHRWIMSAPDGIHVDHIDGDGLNCCRYNLRFATPRQNMFNRRASNSTGYKGVSRHGPSYRFQISIDGKRTPFGGYLTAKDAALAFDQMAREVYGEFAYLNFPEVTDYSQIRRYTQQLKDGT